MTSPPQSFDVADADATRDVGRRLGTTLRAGAVVVLTGDLGAGKTTFVQGLAAALDVSGSVTSPTFVISRVHQPRGGGPALVHVDAYRLTSMAELDDLDLDAELDDAVTVVEWGDGVATRWERPAVNVHIERDRSPRRITVVGAASVPDRR